MMTNGPGPIRYRRSRRRNRNTTGGSVAEMQTAAQNLGRMRWFRRPRRTKRVTFCNEEVTMLVTEASESSEQAADDVLKPAGVLPQYQYTREELIQFQTHPDAKKRPDCLDPCFNNSRGVWDPERWHLDKKRSETPPEDERASRGDLNVEHKRRSGDPRERIRKEQDGIVLSPQRRSFNSGCFVTVNQNRRAESPLGKSDRDVGHRDMVPARRIGSGRILTRDVWDYRLERDKDLDQQAEYGFQRSSSGVNIRDRERDERFERRSFGREFERDREKERHRNERSDRLDRSRFDRRRAYSDSKEEEPEWFSGGPTSQHDTIELRGFDDIPEEQGSRKHSPQTKSTKSNSRTSNSRKSSDVTAPQQQQNSDISVTGHTTPMQVESSMLLSGSQSPVDDKNPIKSNEATVMTATTTIITAATTVSSISDQQNSINSEKQSMWMSERIGESGSRPLENSEFNLDDFLKIDALPLPGLLTNGAAMEGQVGSRFSQWFRRDSPVNQPESRRSSLQDELLNNIINDITEPNIVIPSISESNTYFAPISPAANTATVSASAVGSSASSNVTSSISSNNAVASDGSTTMGVKPTLLLEMLQRGGQSQSNPSENSVPPIIRAPSIRDLEAAGKMQSVEELEARMRQQGLNIAKQNNKNVNHQQSHKKTEEDLAAFKKLLAQVSDGKVIPAAAKNGAPHQKPQPLNFIQMLSKTQDSSTGRTITSGSTNTSASTDRIGLGPMTGFGLNTQPSPTVNHNMVNSQPQQMQIPQDLVMKLLQVQQQQQQQQQRQQQHEMLNKLLASNQQQQQNQATSRLSHIPVTVPVPTQFQVPPPPPPSLSPLPPELQMMITNAQPSRELLQRPEAQAIIQGLKHGEITSQHLVQQLQNPAMQHRHREVLVSILKLQMQPGFSPRATSPHPHVQQPDLLHQMMLQQQQQQHQQQQLRIPSPLNNAYCQQPPVISPNMANNPNTLSVQHTVLPHRVPSPRELIVHTQNIMQSALIKKKLEEQRENYRKRQEMQQSLSPNVAGMSSNSTNNAGKIESSSPAKHLASPTPLAFTPTSVLRKMTAEKEPDAAASSNARNDGKTSASNEQMKPHVSAQPSQHRSTVSNAQMRSQQSTAPQWSMAKHQGRAIVKGNANFQYAANVDFQQQQQQQQLHQHRHNSMLSGSGSYSNNMPRSKMTMPTPPPNIAPQFNSLMMMHRPPNVRAQAIQAHLAALHLSHQAPQQQTQQQQRNLSTPSLQQILLNQNFNNQGRGSGKSDSRMMRSQHSQAMSTGRQGQTMNFPVSRDMSTSPTSNQLARWFSPELLAQARAGQLPDMPPILSTQNMLSLEELERLQQASAAGS